MYGRILNIINLIINRRRHRVSVAQTFFERFIAIIILVNLALIVLSSFDYKHDYHHFIEAINYISAFIFMIEYILRIIVAPRNHRELPATKARYKYLVSFYGIVDLISIIPFFVPDFLADDFPHFNTVYLMKIVLIFKIVRYSNTLTFMFEVFHSVRNELFMSWGFGIIIIIISGYLMYIVEANAQPEVFYNMGQGFWWSIITFTTVGYGDIYPITAIGKILASFIALIGIGMIAVPSGIISSAFIKRMNERINEKVKAESPISKKNICPHCGQNVHLDYHK